MIKEFNNKFLWIDVRLFPPRAAREIKSGIGR
jgi:hypothetical protein